MSDNKLLDSQIHDVLTRENIAYSLPGAWANYCSQGMWKYYRHHEIMEDGLMRIFNRQIRFLIVNCPSQIGKSDLCSKAFPSWYAGRRPNERIGLVSYEANFAESWGRKSMDWLEQYGPSIFNVTINPDKRSGQHWETLNLTSKKSAGGGMKTAGIGGQITGNAYEGFIIEDPVKNPREAQSTTKIREVIDFMQGAVWPRIRPNTWVILVMCMTGDTPILMADGTINNLKDIKIGDRIYAWKDKQLVKRTVLNFRDQGLDDIYEIKTGNNTVKANARHPFLFKTRKNKYKWIRVEDFHTLNKTDCLVVQGAIEDTGIELISEDEAWLLGYMFGDGWITIRKGIKKAYKNKKAYLRKEVVTCIALSNHEYKNVKVEKLLKQLFNIKGTRTSAGYIRTEQQKIGRWCIEHGLIGKAKTKRLPKWLFSQSLKVKEAFLDGYVKADGYETSTRTLFCVSNKELLEDVRVLYRSCGYCPSNITSWSGVGRPPNSPKPINYINYQLGVSKLKKADWHFRKIKSVKKLPQQEIVYDITVDDAECFVADGLISHNTRWGTEDLTAWMIQQLKKINEPYEHIIIPGIADSEDDPVGRAIGDPLWPEERSLKFWEDQKQIMGPYWFSSIIQQHPINKGGNIIKTSWFRRYTERPARTTADMIVFSIDAAQKAEEIHDYTVIGVWYVVEGTKYYLVDMVRDRFEHPDLLTIVMDMAELWKPHLILVENKGAGTSLLQHLDKETSYATLAIDPRSDKEMRAITESAVIKSGHVYVPLEGTQPWIFDFEQEVASFPASKYNDIVDMLSQFLFWAREKRVTIELW